jgi:hypothetical protein
MSRGGQELLTRRRRNRPQKPRVERSGTLVSCPRNSMYFVAIKMGRRQGARSGASRTTFYTPGTLGLEGSMKVVRDVTDEQRRRRPIFIATLRAGASWPFFCVALSARPAPFLHRLRNGHTSKRQKWGGMGARSRLEKQPTDFRQNICYFGDRTLGLGTKTPSF